MSEPLLEYVKGEKVLLKDYYDEAWLKDKMVADPSLLNLGELEVIDQEHVQSSGGRIDLLLSDPDYQTYYEVEVMLGRTDESHIIRTIEYWDIENRKSPSKDHVAVIVAEEITNRFFNVIYLINRSIPIIAIQLNALKIDNKLLLNFTKVLDIYEEQEEPSTKKVDRKYWESKANPKSIAVMDEIISQIKKSSNTDNRINIIYTQSYIAMAKGGYNFIAFKPRSEVGKCTILVKIKRENSTDVINLLEELHISYSMRKDNLISVFLNNEADYYNNKDRLDTFFVNARDYY